MTGRFSRRQFLASSAAVSGGVASAVGLGLDPSRLLTPSAEAAAAPMSNGLGYPGLADKAVLGAELQYFRMSPSAIPARLDLCKQAHYSIIQTYVPWNVHEWVQGTFDFTGRTTPILPDDHFDEYQIEDPLSETQDGGLIGRVGLTANTDLESYLAACHARGFKMILRPGPFISDEWRNGGLPDWLLLEADETMFEYGPDGTALTPGFPFSPPVGTVLGGSTLYYFPSPSYASAHYLGATRTWLHAFVAFLRRGRWFVSEGGPVVGLQVDDESCFFYRFGAFEVDYNPAMLQRWAAYSHNKPAPRGWPQQTGDPRSLKTSFEWQTFKAHQNADYLGVLAADLVAAGARVPINHELEQNMVPPTDMVLVADQVVLNGEFYEGSDATVLPLNEIIAQSIRAASRQSRRTFATEMNNGDPLLFNLLIGEGIHGGLQFTYTEGVSDGALEALRTVGRTFDAAGPMLGSATRRADVAVVWQPRLTFAPFGSERWGFRSDVRAVIESHVPALATLLIRAGYAFDFVDESAARPVDLQRYPTIFLAAADIMPAAFQRQLADYVHGGGRLVCWPAPPTRDDTLEPCTILADACFRQRATGTDETDGAPVRIGHTTVPVWRGVTTYKLDHTATAIAWLGPAPCGYAARHGAGTAVLLGSWLAADSVAGRAGDVIQAVMATPGLDPAATLVQLASSHLAAAVPVPEVLPGGTPRSYQVWAYPNQRRGGETIASGGVGYFDGENVVMVAQVDTSSTEPLVNVPPYHPILASHIDAVRSLADVTPQVIVDDTHVQARVLDGPKGGATVALCNRFFDDVAVVLRTRVDGVAVRLPRTGTFALPAQTGVLCPINYPLGHGRVLNQATAQLLDYVSTRERLAVTLLAPAGGEVVIDGVAVTVPAGESTVVRRYR